MSNIEWADPPASGPGRMASAFTAEVVDALRANPGRWALIRKAHSSGAVLTGFVKRHPGFEGTARSSVRDGRRVFDIYVRYVGDEVA